MPRTTVTAHSAVQAPKNASWARRSWGFRHVATKAPAAARSRAADRPGGVEGGITGTVVSRPPASGAARRRFPGSPRPGPQVARITAPEHLAPGAEPLARGPPQDEPVDGREPGIHHVEDSGALDECCHLGRGVDVRRNGGELRPRSPRREHEEPSGRRPETREPQREPVPRALDGGGAHG